MNTLSLKQIELYNIIRNFDIQEIEKIISYAKVNTIISQKSTRKSLSGIWSNLGFENIDLDKEIRQLRSDVYNNTTWNTNNSK
jgi:hypothetical protein